MGPTYYDILGVSPDAGAEEIKRAWRDAADRFEPGSGSAGNQFRLFNQAAEVLLDPVRRAEYDTELAGRPEPAGSAPSGVPTRSSEAAPAGACSGSPDPKAAETTVTPPGEPKSRALSRPPRWLLAVLGVLALVLVVVAAGYGIPKLRAVRNHDAVQAAGQAAQPAAERAADVVLAYDYKSLSADEKAAEQRLTPKYRKKYTATFDKLVRPHATLEKAHVVADVRASGVVHADPDRVAVLLFVNQTTRSTANSGKPQVALNRVQMTMVKLHGSWLVDDITSY